LTRVLVQIAAQHPMTARRDKDARPEPDLVNHKFNVERPNQLWVADITFVPTAAGFLYLAVVLNTCSLYRPQLMRHL
jgi:putative transposase